MVYPDQLNCEVELRVSYQSTQLHLRGHCDVLWSARQPADTVKASLNDVSTVTTSWSFTDMTTRYSLQQPSNPPNLSFGNCELHRQGLLGKITYRLDLMHHACKVQPCTKYLGHSWSLFSIVRLMETYFYCNVFCIFTFQMNNNASLYIFQQQSQLSGYSPVLTWCVSWPGRSNGP